MVNTSDKKIVPAVFTGISAVFIFIVSIFFAARYSHSFQKWYTTNEYFDWRTMAISHFGVSNLAIPFTVIVCLVSLMLIYFINAVKAGYGNKGLLKRGTSWIIAGVVSLMFAFIFMLYKPTSIPSIAIHFLFAGVYFTAIPLGMIMVGLFFLKKNKRQLGYISLVLGILAFIFGPIICMGSSIILNNKGVAVPEFIQIIIEDIWMIFIAIDILNSNDIPRRRR